MGSACSRSSAVPVNDAVVHVRIFKSKKNSSNPPLPAQARSVPKDTTAEPHEDTDDEHEEDESGHSFPESYSDTQSESGDVLNELPSLLKESAAPSTAMHLDDGHELGTKHEPPQPGPLPPLRFGCKATMPRNLPPLDMKAGVPRSTKHGSVMHGHPRTAAAAGTVPSDSCPSTNGLAKAKYTPPASGAASTFKPAKLAKYSALLPSEHLVDAAAAMAAAAILRGLTPESGRGSRNAGLGDTSASSQCGKDLLSDPFDLSASLPPSRFESKRESGLITDQDLRDNRADLVAAANKLHKEAAGRPYSRGRQPSENGASKFTSRSGLTQKMPDDVSLSGESFSVHGCSVMQDDEDLIAFSREHLAPSRFPVR